MSCFVERAEWLHTALLEAAKISVFLKVIRVVCVLLHQIHLLGFIIRTGCILTVPVVKQRRG